MCIRDSDQDGEAEGRDQRIDADSQAVSQRRGDPVALPSLHRIADDQCQARPRADGPHHANGGQRQPTRQLHTFSSFVSIVVTRDQGRGWLAMPEVKVMNRIHSQWL